MVNLKPYLASLVVAAVVMAGCSGKDPNASVATGPVLPSHAGDAAFDDLTGAIKGFVLNDEALPVAAAALLLVPGRLEAHAAADGGFTFNFLKPGTYTIHATSVGFKNGQARVDVAQAKTAYVEVLLEQLPVAQPRKEVLSYDGFLECRWASFGSGVCGSTGVCLAATGCITTNPVVSGLWTRDKNEMLFQLTGEDWEQIVFEVRWTPSTIATNSKMGLLFSYKERPGNHEFGSSSNLLSPITWTYTKGTVGENARIPANTPKEPNTTLTLRTWLAVGADVLDVPDEDPAGVAYETRYQMFVTIFYGQAAPEKYSAFPDA